MKRDTVKELLNAAIAAREKSYSPYSSYSVGAALLTSEGKMYTGANIESSVHTPTVCAERVAFFSAVHAGERSFEAIAIVGGNAEEDIKDFCAPCGVCRQVMAEFCGDDFRIILSNGKKARIYKLCDLLPLKFSLDK